MRQLIYGKDTLEKIVGIECKDNIATIFREPTPGYIRVMDMPFEQWILFSQELSPKFKRLDGKLPYKWYIGYDSSAKYREILTSSRKKGRDFFTCYRPDESAMIKDGYTYFKGMELEDVSVLSFDIEAVGLEHNSGSKVLLISNTYRAGNKVVKKLFCYDDYGSSREFLEAWCEWVREIDPSVICGHNIFGYDIPYIQHCAKLAGAKLKLGRDASAPKVATKPSFFRKDGSQAYDFFNIEIYGRQLIDTMFMAIKYDVGRKYSSYGLKTLIAEEGLEKADRVFYDAAKIGRNYKDPIEWVKIKAYAEDDADDALALFDLMAPAYFKYTQIVPMSFQQIINKATGRQVDNTMIRSYLQIGHSIPKPSPAEQYEGGIAYGNPGIYRPTYKVDVASLYPSIIRQYKIYDRDKDPKAHFLQIVEQLTLERLENKRLAAETGKRSYLDLSNAQKILINSAYGFLGAERLQFNSPRNAATVTKRGRAILTKGVEWAQQKGFSIANVDTDSFMYAGPTLAYGKAKKGEVSQFHKDIEELNSLFPPLIQWEDDGCYKGALIIKAKNYALDDGKSIKIKGSALKATMKESALKVFLSEVIDLLLQKKKDRVFHLYLSYVNRILEIEDMSEWAFRKTITKSVLNPERAQEERVLAAIEGKPYVEGDKVHLFFKSKEEYACLEDFDGVYDQDILLAKLKKTIEVFSTVLDVELFPDLTLVRNKDLVA